MRIFIAEPPASEFVALFSDRLDDGIEKTDEPETADVLIAGRPKTEWLESNPNLKAVIIPFAGVPEVTRDLLRQWPQVALYNLHHNASSTAEMAIALMMAAGRKLIPLDEGLRKGEWAGRTIPVNKDAGTQAMSFDGSNALILGYGEIGRRIASVCLALGMSVEAIRRNPESPIDGEVRFTPMRQLRDALQRADVVHIATPLTEETNGLIGKTAIAQMKHTAILINVARGPIVDEEALFDALNNNRIAGAGLDVWWQYPTTEEPTKAPSRFDFATLDNVVMTPHLGGANADTERRRMVALADLLNNLHSGIEVKRVDLEAGY